MTIVGCANATGQAIPPMVIFDAQKLNYAWTKGEFPGTKYRLSGNGWINTDLFESWLSEHFVEHAVSACPLLLLLDGHSTHYQLQSGTLAKIGLVIIVWIFLIHFVWCLLPKVACVFVCAPSSCFRYKIYNIKLVPQCRAAKAACSGVA